MSPSLPRSVRNALGEEPAEDLELWLEFHLNEHAETQEGDLDTIDYRFARIDYRMKRIDRQFDRMEALMTRMRWWTVGTIALFGTLITVLITVAEFF